MQLAAFLVILLASAGLYYAARQGADAAMGALLALTAVAMAATVWIS